MWSLAACSESGCGHENEDAWVAEAHSDSQNCLLCAVADGQGGRSGGRKAANVACDSFLASANQMTPMQLATTKTWPTLLGTVDRAVSGDTEAGFTTLAALCINDRFVTGASSGDSAVLLIQSESAIWLSGEQHKNPPVGSAGAVFRPFQVRLAWPWQVILITDGVWKYVGMEKLAELASNHASDELIDKAKKLARLLRSGEFQDDFTMVVVSNRT